MKGTPRGYRTTIEKGSFPSDLSLPADARAAGVARQAIRERLSGILASPKLHDAMLLTSELVTNAVQHARRRAIELDIRAEPGYVRITVTDDGPGFVAGRPRPRRETGGFGLHLVERIADRWGTEASPHRVWFELDA